MKIRKGIYEHFKGKHYEVIGCGHPTETDEQFVIYKELGEKIFGFVQSKCLNEFLSEHGKMRFTFIERT